MPEIGKHLIVGWLGFEETRTLAAKGAIAGVFLTRKDFPLGASSEDIRRTVDALQTARRDAGLPSLWVATDQEGGPVAKLSPPLPVQAALGSLLTDLDGPEPARAAEIVSRVTAYADTHHFAARLDASSADLTITDWVPFREISQRTEAGIMLSHVRLTALDPDHPSSCSRATVKLLREKWGATGLLVTDDFSMSPIFHGRGGIVSAAEQSRVAGVDLILLSYDAAAVYDLLAANLEKNPPGRR